MADSEASPESSQRVADRYLVVAELGAGGVGKVYEAIDESTGRRVALKQLRATAREQADFVTLFKREYYTLKQLSHPLFVEVYEYGVDSAGPFFTMELLSGRDLAKCGALPWRETCRVLRDVASGLAVLHSRGLVYRDLSAHNVRLGADGQAKLLDFGAMASGDVAQSKVVGTPPFVAPEALHGQPLDARTDLYALGALGYYMLTRCHAYPAHRFDQLRDCWRTAPRPASALGVESPPALDELLLSLLSIDPRARPPHAAEVIDRLGALAELPPLPAALEARAYLNRPTLVARDRETLAMRKQLIRMLRGRGGALCIEAAPGMGRTRLLEELALEAKLMGALVLHVQARSGGQRYETIRQLCSQLMATLPEIALETALPFLSALRAIVPELAEQPAASDETSDEVAAVDADERWARAQVALVGWLEAVCRRRPLVIAVDDLQLCDDATSAVIAGLALCTGERRMVVAATLRAARDSALTGSRATFREHARRIEIEPLNLAATVGLYRHIFGDVPYLSELASWAQRIAKGSVQDCVTLANDLVDRGVIRYAGGMWVLPMDLQQQALPTSLAQAFAQRLDGLSEAAWAVARTLCVAGDAASLAACMAFCADSDEARVFAALDELLAADLLLCDGQVYAFRQPAIREAVDARLDDQQRSACHRRIGLALLAREPRDATERLHAARHLLRGREDALGVDLVGVAIASLTDIAIEIDELGIDALELALHACERLGRPSPEAMHIRLLLLPCAFYFDHALVGYGLPAVARLEQDSGMSQVSEQDPTKPLLDRIVLALGKAVERHQQLPEAERLFDPIRSAKELGKALLAMQAIYSTQFDIETARACCKRFEPLAALTPMAKLCHDAALAAIDALVGRIEPAIALQQDVVVRTQALLASMQEAGADPNDVVVVRALLASMAYVVALRLACTRPQESLRLADLIDRMAPNRHKAGAAQLRVLTSYLMGDADASVRFQADYEQRLMRFRQHGSSGVDLSYRIRAYELGRDLLGLQAAGREAEALSERRPGYRPFLHLCRGHAFGLRGELERGLDEFRKAAELAPAGKHLAWASAISEVARVLVELGRLTEARACIERARHDNTAQNLGRTLEGLLLPALAQLDALEGNSDSAKQRLHEALQHATAEGHARLVRGHLLIQLMSVALAARDRALFEQHALELQELYRDTDQRGLHGAYKRLIERARTENLIESAPRSPALEAETNERRKVESILSACTDAGARAQSALSLLVDALRAPSGYLFALRGGELVVVAAPPDRPRPPKSMIATLGAYLTAELTDDEAATATSFDRATETQTQIFEDGRCYRPIVLRASNGGESVVAGIAVLEVQPQQAELLPSRVLVAALSEQLIRSGDVEPARG